MPGTDYDDQADAQSRVMAMFSVLSAPLHTRRRAPEPDLPPGRPRPSRDPRTGRFRAAPEQLPAPDDDTVLSLAAAADAAGPATGGPVRSRGRDHTGETMRSAQPAPRPAESAHVREIMFPAAEHEPDCRCYTCFPSETPYWRPRSRRRRQ